MASIPLTKRELHAACGIIIIMKGKTKTLIEQVRKALLALPDPVLMKTLAEWLDGADEHIQYLDMWRLIF